MAVTEALAGAVFRGADAVRDGLVTAGELRGPRFRRLYQGVYVDRGVRVDHGVRCSAALLAVSHPAVVSGSSAAWLLGARCAAGVDDPVEVTVAEGMPARSQPGLVVRRRRLDAAEVRSRAGVPVTAALRTAWDVAAGAPLRAAVPVLDDLLHRRVVDEARLADFASARAGWPGAARARLAIGLSDGRAESPPESAVRLELVLAGLLPEPQVEVRHGGRLVARVDLGFPGERVAVEYDGAYHGEAGQLARDRTRLNALQARGWRVVFVTAPDLRDLNAVVERVTLALAQARHPHPA